MHTALDKSSDESVISETLAFKLLPRQALACLVHCIPIEFLPVHYASWISIEEKEQVDSHIPIIEDNDNFDTLHIISPSEPVLSEATYFVMNDRRSGFNVPQAIF